MKRLTLLLCGTFFSFLLRAQMHNVSGIVRDASNQPVEAATVKVKGSSIATTTDVHGKFMISVPGNAAILQISSVGFTAKELNGGSATYLEISLDQVATSMNDVVVTALGIRRQRRSLGYAVSEIKGEDLTKAREINLGNALEGRVAGLNASPTATGAGGSSRVVIRGATSIRTDNQPLYVVNGVPIDNTQQGSPSEYGGADYGDGLSSINPDDIESISVLKGGAAAALYGSRAGQGVILITTKSSRSTKGLGVDVSTSYTLEKPLTITDWQQQYGGGTQGRKPASVQEAQDNSRWGWGGKLDGGLAYAPDGLQHPYLPAGNNFKRFYNTGTTFTNSVALNGGNEAANFRLSLGGVGNNSIIPNSGFNRKTISLAVNGKPNKKISFESSISYVVENGRNRPTVSDNVENVNSAIYTLASNVNVDWLAPGYDSLGYEAHHFGSDVYAQTPYFTVNKVIENDGRNRFLGMGAVTFNLTDHWYLKGRAGLDNIAFQSTNIDPTGIAFYTPGQMNQRQENRTQYTAEGIVGYRKTVGDLTIDAFAGSMRQHYQTRGVQVSGGDFKTPFLYFISNLRNRSFNNTFTESEVNSVYGSADIGFRNYLFLTVTGRQDWFSTLNPKSNNIFYPSVSTGFVFSDVIKMPSWINYGKVRASWANVGGGDPRPYATVLTYSALNDNYLGQPLMTTNGSVVPNPSLKPFNVRTSEVGIELKTLNNKLGIDATYYNKRTTNDIVDASTSASSGYRSTTINVGEMTNKGVELLLTYSAVNTASFGWDISFNYAYNKNMVGRISATDTGQAAPIDLGFDRDNGAVVSLVQGQPFGVIRAYHPIINDKGQYVVGPSGLLQRDNPSIAGYGVSPTTMGLVQNFRFRNFFASVLVDAKFGGDLFSSTNYLATYSGLSKTTLQGREGGMRITGVKADGTPSDTTVSAETYWDNWSSRNSYKLVFDASFIKLRSVSIGYALPAKILGKTPFTALRVSVIARNLAVLYSKVPNVDPESNFRSGNAQGLERLGVPVTRSMGFSVQARF